MKKDIIKLLIFSTLFFVSIMLLFSIRIMFHKSYIIDKNVTTIIAGDSHTQFGINDIFLNGVQNISINAESYFYSYYKITEIFKHNPQIDHIILGFSYHNISSYYDDYIFGKDAQSILLRYIDILSFESLTEMNLFSNSDLIRYILKALISPSIDYSYIGKFVESKEKFDEDSMKTRINNQFFFEKNVRNFSRINLKYLKKITKLCGKYNIKFTLINTPLNRKYFDEIPPLFINTYFEIIQEFDLTLIDFSELYLSNDCFLPDGDHLNTFGAEKFTKMLNDEIEINLSE